MPRTLGVPDDLIARFAAYEIDPGDEAIPACVTDASARIAAIYAGLLAEGVDDEIVARAMLGATVSLYDALGLSEILPALFRTVASKLEREAARPN